MIRYFPAKGTAGLVRFAVNVPKREPSPPAKITARVFILIFSLPLTKLDFEDTIIFSWEHDR
jgi:hypothetical protein